MKKQSATAMILLMTIGILLSAAFAGCSSQGPPASPAPAKNQATVELSRMALQPSEVPAGFALVEKSDRNASDMRDWSMNLGWKRGYDAIYLKNGSEPRFLEQHISVYTPANISLIMPDTVRLVKNWTDANVSVEEVPVRAIGDASRSLKVSDKSDNTSAYLITFVKYDVYEELWTNMTAADYDNFVQLAGTAAAKIQ